MNRVDLSARDWAQSGGSHARGCAHLDDRFLTAKELAATLDACATDAAWVATVNRLNGCFAAATLRDGRLLAAVDRIRSIPLFYTIDGDDVRLSDSAYRVIPQAYGGGTDDIVDTEFRLTGYVTGMQTLHAGVLQVEAGQAVIFEASRTGPPKRLQYHEFRHGNFLPANSDLIARLESVHARVFRRLLQSAGGRALAVPLSGGYDSRLIGASLRELGARDVVCYSYGVPGNWESRISQELANYLGFRWEFVPYSPERWRDWAARERFAAYFRAAGNLTSVPHIQDWPAVLELQRDGRVPPDSVFVPGHSGDFLAGSHIPTSYAGRSLITRRELLDSLLSAHYSLWDWPSGRQRELREQFDRRIEAVVGPIADGAPEQAADVFERWDLQERQAKFIANSARVYEDFGFEWRLPLFDHELMDFWARIPLELRVARKLYFEFVRRRQALPVTEANTDRGAVASWLIRAIDHARLRPLAKHMQRVLRRWRWRDVYAGSPLAWLALVDREQFRRSYTGKELLHSYLVLRYRDYVAKLIAERGHE
jgi:asparagine synthase (glutamine-hydrolysing)